jgi:hypothetical protein
MPPTPKATRQEIEALLNAFGGEVAAVAEKLDVSRTVLYRKFKRWGTDLGLYRRQEHTFTPEAVYTVTNFGAERLGVNVSTVSTVKAPATISSGATCPADASDPTLGGMEQSAAGHSASAPIGTVRKIDTPRLPKEMQHEIQRFRLAYQAKVGREMTNTDVAEMHHRDTFAAWAAAMLSGDAQ